jgi:hypothetical protein
MTRKPKVPGDVLPPASLGNVREALDVLGGHPRGLVIGEIRVVRVVHRWLRQISDDRSNREPIRRCWRWRHERGSDIVAETDQYKAFPRLRDSVVRGAVEPSHHPVSVETAERGQEVAPTELV